MARWALGSRNRWTFSLKLRRKSENQLSGIGTTSRLARSNPNFAHVQSPRVLLIFKPFNHKAIFLTDSLMAKYVPGTWNKGTFSLKLRRKTWKSTFSDLDQFLLSGLAGSDSSFAHKEYSLVLSVCEHLNYPRWVEYWWWNEPSVRSGVEIVDFLLWGKSIKITVNDRMVIIASRNIVLTQWLRAEELIGHMSFLYLSSSDEPRRVTPAFYVCMGCKCFSQKPCRLIPEHPGIEVGRVGARWAVVSRATGRRCGQSTSINQTQSGGSSFQSRMVVLSAGRDGVRMWPKETDQRPKHERT